MSVFFQPGQELDENDLSIFIRNTLGAEYPEIEVWFSLYVVDCCGDPTGFIAVPDQNMVAATKGSGVGHWWADWIIPNGQPTDKYQIRWTFRIAPTEPLQQRRLNFQIVSFPIGTYREALVTDLPGTPIVVVQ